MNPDLEDRLKMETNPHEVGEPPTIYGVDIVLEGGLPKERVVILDHAAVSRSYPILSYAAGVEIVEVDLDDG